MEKIKKWRRFALALLSLLFTVTLLAAVLMVSPYRAFAEEATLVLPENTATYTIDSVQDGKDNSNNEAKWSYDPAVNLWSIPWAYRTTIARKVPTLTATVKTSGTVAFEYLIELDVSDDTTSEYNENRLLESKFVFTVTPSEGASDRKEEKYYGTYGELANKEFEYISFDVQEGDTVKFSLEIENEIDLNSKININWYLHGLGVLSEELASQYALGLQAASLSEVMPIAESYMPEKSGEGWTETGGAYYLYTSDSTDYNGKEYSLTYTIEGAQEISFDIWYWASANAFQPQPYSGTYNTGLVKDKFFYKITIDQKEQTIEPTHNGFTQENSIDGTPQSPPEIPQITIPSEEQREWHSLQFQTNGEGSHTVKIIFSALDNQLWEFQPTVPNFGSVRFASAFGVRNVSFKKISMKTVTFPGYDSAYGKISYTMSGDTQEIPAKGTSVTVPEGAAITLKAEPKKFVKSSKIDYAAVRPVFTVDGEIKADNSYQFTADENKVISYAFKQEAPKPIVWAQVINGEQENAAFLASSGRAIEIPGTGKPTLRLFLADYAVGGRALGGTYSVKVNGVNAELQDVTNFEQVQLPEALKGSTAYLWLGTEIEEALVIEVTYTVEDVQPHTVTFRTKFTAEAKAVESGSTNIYNNLFTEDSEEGAYFTDIEGQKDESLWHPASANGNFTVETSTVYTGFQRTLAFGDRAVWRQSILTLLLQNARSGLVTFDIKLSGQRDSAIHAGVVLVASESPGTSDCHLDTQLASIESWKENQTTSRETSGNVTSFTRLLAPTAGGGAEIYPHRFDAEGKIATLVSLGNGWFRVTVPTKANVQYSAGSSTGTKDANFLRFTLSLTVEAGYEASMQLRNVTFINASEVTITSKSSTEGGTVSATGLAEDGKTAAFGSTVKFTAETGDKKLYGWTVKTNKGDETFYPVSEKSDNTFEYFAVQSAEVTAWIADENTYHVYLGGTLYASLNDALSAAENNPTYKTVTALDSFEENGAVTIPQGVTFLLPYNSAGQFTKTGGTLDRIAWISGKAPYLTVTLKGNVTVNGTLNVGGIVGREGQKYHGHTSGDYAELVLGGTMSVKEGGVVNVYGHVKGGSIDVESGGLFYEPFLILDFSGGTNTLALFEAGQTPFKRYAMVNVESPLTIHHGAQLIGHASLHAMGMFLSLDQAFISDKNGDGKGSDTFIMLHSNASVKIEYDPNKTVDGTNYDNCTEGIGKTTMTFTGGADFSYMQFSAMGVSVPTKDVDFAIPYNYEIQLASGDFATKTKFKLMPGSIVNVKSGANLTLNADTYVLDGLVQSGMSGKSYPSAEQLAAAKYSTNAQLIVDGTLIVKSNTTFLGVVQTNGSTGKITIEKGVTLKGTIVDGARTSYDCNYSIYSSSARLWDKVHEKLCSIPVGSDNKAEKALTFNATWVEDDKTWTVSGITMQYESKNGSHREDEHTLATETLSTVSGMVGSWMVVHTDHIAPEWEYDAQKDGTAGENGHKQLTRYCTELGCDHQFHKELFNTPDELADVYKGKEFTDSDLEALFKKFFEGFPAGVTVTAATDQQTNKGTYEVTVTLEGGFFLEGDEFVDHVTIRWRITPFILSAETAECSGTATTVYNGGEQKLTPSVNTAAGVLQSGDFKISYSEDVTNVGEVTVKVTGQGNFGGSVTWTYEITPIQVTLQLTQQSTDYTGNEPTVKSEGTFTATGILDGDKGNVQIELALKGGQGTDGWNVGDYGLTASLTCTDGHENYVLANPATIYENMLRIVPKSIAEANVVLNAETFTYSGAAQTPFKELELAGYTFRDGDYEVSYSANTNAGEATVTVTGRGNFTGKTETTFKIDPLSLAGAKITAAACTYNGAPQTPTLTVQVGTLNLTSESDYTVQYNNNTNAGEATVTITGRNNFCETAEGHFEIAQAQVTITAENKNSPEGQNLVTLTYTITGYFEEEATLRAALKISVADGTETGKAGNKFAITVAFKETEGANAFPNYTFTFTNGEYTITAAVFANVTFEDGSAVYDRKTHTLEADLVDPDDKDGTFGATYSYKKGDSAVEEMRDAGTYTVTLHLTFTVSESEVYSVELERTFTITPATITKVTVTAGDFTYTGKQITPTLTVETDGLTLTAEEYTVSYGAHDNINAGTVEVTVTASSTNFVGSAKTDFEIAKRDISDAEVSVSGSYTYNGTPIVPKTEEVTVTLDDYDVTFSVSASDNTNASENVPVTVTGTGNFSGSAEGTFRIAPKAAKVTVQPQSHVYSGTQPTLTAEKGTDWVSSDICGDDDLQITLTAVAKGEAWDVGTYSVEGRSANGNYTVEFLACENKCTITPKSITVTIMDAESEYGEEIAPLTWTIPEGALGAGDEKSDLGVTLALMGGETRRTVGTYRIEANADAKNYTVTFAGSMDGTYGTYTVTRRNITVTILPQHAVYDNAAPVLSELQDVAWTVEEGAIVEGDTLGVRLTLTAPEDGKWNAGNYVIGGTASNTNYQVAFSEDVKFTIERRAVTVTVADQSADYDYLYEYAKDGSAWTVEAEALAQGEDRDDLQITLDFGVITTAGTYPIRGECANNNYAVTFRGSREDCGTYTVNKKDLSEGRAIFRLSSGDKTSGNYTLTVALSSEFIDLDSSASVFEGTTPKTLQTTVTPSRLTEVGTHKVQIEIVDDNYCGGAEFTVIVTYANGYTERLQTTMQRLRELAEGKSADALKEEDFDDLKEMATLLAALNAEERGLAADDLEKYDDLVNAWNDLADLDGIIETAEAVASAPLSGLFGAISTLTALAALAFVVTKGGLL